MRRRPTNLRGVVCLLVRDSTRQLPMQRWRRCHRVSLSLITCDYAKHQEVYDPSILAVLECALKNADFKVMLVERAEEAVYLKTQRAKIAALKAGWETGPPGY